MRWKILFPLARPASLAAAQELTVEQWTPRSRERLDEVVQAMDDLNLEVHKNALRLIRGIDGSAFPE